MVIYLSDYGCCNDDIFQVFVTVFLRVCPYSKNYQSLKRFCVTTATPYVFSVLRKLPKNIEKSMFVSEITIY